MFLKGRSLICIYIFNGFGLLYVSICIYVCMYDCKCVCIGMYVCLYVSMYYVGMCRIKSYVCMSSIMSEVKMHPVIYYGGLNKPIVHNSYTFKGCNMQRRLSSRALRDLDTGLAIIDGVCFWASHQGFPLSQPLIAKSHHSQRVDSVPFTHNTIFIRR